VDRNGEALTQVSVFLFFWGFIPVFMFHRFFGIMAPVTPALATLVLVILFQTR
jgi:hypothetical protein